MIKKCVLIANSAFTIINFRRELIESLTEKGFEIIVICPPECKLLLNDIESEFKDLDVDFKFVTFSRSGKNPIDEFKLFLTLYKLLHEIKPDIVFNYTIKATIYGSIAAFLNKTDIIVSNITGLGYVFTANDLKTVFLRCFVKGFYKIALNCNSLIFFQNPDDLADFRKFGLINNSHKVKIINGSGVNLSKFQPNYHIEKIPMSFIFIGRLLEDKGIYEFINAAKKIRKEFPQSKFRVLGSLDENPKSISLEYLSEIRKSGLIEYTEHTSNVYPYLASSEVFVLPSYREGTPRAVLEAMSVGLPIITTLAPGCKETVEDGYNGFLVEVKNVDALYDRMKTLLTNSELKTSMGINSLKLVTSKYDVTKVNDSILSAIEDL